jgi:hypothetical protein
VVDGDGALVGIVSYVDLLRELRFDGEEPPEGSPRNPPGLKMGPRLVRDAHRDDLGKETVPVNSQTLNLP